MDEKFKAAITKICEAHKGNLTFGTFGNKSSGYCPIAWLVENRIKIGDSYMEAVSTEFKLSTVKIWSFIDGWDDREMFPSTDTEYYEFGQSLRAEFS